MNQDSNAHWHCPCCSASICFIPNCQSRPYITERPSFVGSFPTRINFSILLPPEQEFSWGSGV